MQAVCAGGAARKDDKVPHLVPGATLADARLAVKHWAALVGKLWQERQEKSEATVIESQLVTSASRPICAAGGAVARQPASRQPHCQGSNLDSTLVLLGNDLVGFADTVMIARHTRRFIWQNFVGTVAFDMRASAS